MKLKKIKADELIFSNEIEDDRTNTYLKLDDYDWMNYELSTRFNTKKLGVLNVKFSYFGFTTSHMEVEYNKNGTVCGDVAYEYPTNIFEKYIKEFLTKHIAQWDDNKYAFNGEEIVLAFYNEVIEKGSIRDTSKDHK